MKFIDRLKLKYHMFKVVRAMEKGNKDQYVKHTTIIHEILWNTLMGA